jgi:DNA recombination protein RmuC
MNTEVVILAALVVIGNGLFVWWLTRRNGGGNNETTDSASMTLLQNQINELSRTLDARMRQSHEQVQKSVEHQVGESQRLIRDITREIAEVKETNKQVFGITASLENLQKVLTNQKQRGNLGEAGLQLILENILPPNAYEMQHAFVGGDIVDAIIKTKDGDICIDAKFSLDNYNRLIATDDADHRLALEREFKNDLKKRIDETAKYIRPNDGTLPIAFMYIPAEGIYYDLLVGNVGGGASERSLIEYAHRDKKVIIVSPTTLVAYLHTVLQGFRAFQIEEQAVKIMKNVDTLGKHLKRYEEYHQKIGRTLATTVNHFNSASQEINKIDKDILRITGTSADLNVDLIDGPRTESMEE